MNNINKHGTINQGNHDNHNFASNLLQPRKSWLNLMLPFALAAAQTTAHADNAAASDFSIDDNFQTGWHEAAFGVGDFISNIVRNSRRPNIDYSMAYAQVGYMVTHPTGDAFWRGSFEVAPEVFGAGIYHGPGSYVAGGTLYFKYNFVPKKSRFVPFVEAGAGVTLMDIPHYYDGKDFNWNLELGVGCHYFVAPRCSLNLEGRIQHISNADMWAHNVGVNSSGLLLGVSLFF